MPTLNLILPVKNARVSSGFGYRVPPTEHASSFHQGVDFAAPQGTPVFSVFNGTVIGQTLNDQYNGNSLKIEYNGDINAVASYLHLSSFNVTVGQSVTQGQIIGYVGSTGLSTGPHLHFQLVLGGKPVDPMPYFYGQNYTQDPETGNQGTTDHSIPDDQQPVDKPRDYVQVVTVEKGQNTLQQFIDAHAVNMTAVELLNYKDNSTVIFAAYDKAHKAKYKKASPDYLTLGTGIKVPLTRIKTVNPYKQNQTLIENKSYVAFIETEIKKLLNNPAYRKLNIGKSDTKINPGQGAVYKRLNQVRVWLWSKTLSPKAEFLIDLSPFIQNLRTTVAEDGGNFTITLPHLTYQQIKDGFNLNTQFYDVPESQISQSFVSKNTSHAFVKKDDNYTCDYTDDNSELSTNDTYAKRKNSFFNTIISENDVVFITFEKIQLDDSDYDTSAGFYKITPDMLKDKVFDMIGLTDAPLVAAQAQGNGQSVVINGRDLIKVLIDDGTYFFPVEYEVQNQEQIIKNSSKSRSAKRLTMQSTIAPDGKHKETLKYAVGSGNLVDDKLFYFDQVLQVQDWITFIFSQLVNVDICPDHLFASYPDKTFIISKTDAVNNDASKNYQRMLANGIWQIIKLVFDDIITRRYVQDSSLATDTGSLLNLVRKVAQKPFVEMISDTYGNKFYFMFRKPPYSEASFKTNKCINIFEGDVIADTLYKCNEVYTWFRLTANGSIIDSNDGSSMIYLPAVLLPEYVEIYGMKILDIQSNYLDWLKVTGDGTDVDLNNIIKQGQQDLDWLIETHAYLPFTRMGTITLKGDRRIKRGMCVRYFPTGEVFYVTDVSQSADFQNAKQNRRVTTLTVTRGMVERHYKKYFNIVRLLRLGQNDKTWSVNTDLFNFFIQNKQYDQ